MSYVLDTNTILHLIHGTTPVLKKRNELERQGNRFIIPSVVRYEVARGLLIKPSRRLEAAYKILCENCLMGQVKEATWEIAAKIYAELYHKRFTVGDADILIAAFCIEHGYKLITNNVKDFMNIDKIQLVDWIGQK